MTFHRFVIVILLALGSLVIIFHFGHPQWHKWIYMQKTYGPLAKYYEPLRPGPETTGTWRHWNREGVLISEVSLLKGEQHGLESRWDNTGQLLYVTRYEHGREVEIVFRPQVIDKRRDFDIPTD